MMLNLHAVKYGLAALVVMATLAGARAQAASSVTASQLESFLGLTVGSGLSSGDLDINGPAMNGSAIMQSITVSAGESLSFDYNFMTNAPPPAVAGYLNALDPFAFVTQPAVSDFADNFSTMVAAPPQSGFLYQTGVTSFSETFATAGTYQLGIGIVNVTTNQYMTGMTVSNIMLGSTSLSGSFSSIGNVSTNGPGSFMLSTAVPEPSSITLLLVGGAGALVGAGRRRFRARARA